MFRQRNDLQIVSWSPLHPRQRSYPHEQTQGVPDKQIFVRGCQLGYTLAVTVSDRRLQFKKTQLLVDSAFLCN